MRAGRKEGIEEIDDLWKAKDSLDYLVRKLSEEKEPI
jgi:hypothetical protein